MGDDGKITGQQDAMVYLCIGGVALLAGMIFLAVNLNKRFGWNLRAASAVVGVVTMTGLGFGLMNVFQEGMMDMHQLDTKVWGPEGEYITLIGIGAFVGLLSIWYMIMGDPRKILKAGKSGIIVAGLGLACMVGAAAGLTVAVANLGDYAQGFETTDANVIAQRLANKSFEGDQLHNFVFNSAEGVGLFIALILFIVGLSCTIVAKKWCM